MPTGPAVVWTAEACPLDRDGATAAAGDPPGDAQPGDRARRGHDAPGAPLGMTVPGPPGPVLEVVALTVDR
ncbi:hypothetical protein [Nocardiopsis sp. CNT312]|uniref:hypothetical protein n=1 Tax=Nocardiopsis sp. CNT312 TaxID=1137268 RepID=UPI0004B43272|nr:hypothetical protein [Nocardiopsis sp. CNT312]